MSAGYTCSEHYCGATPQPGDVWLGNLEDGTEISGFFGTYKPLQTSPGKTLEGKKRFSPSFLSNILLIHINVAEGLGIMPSRDMLGIRFLLWHIGTNQVGCSFPLCNLKKCALLFRNIVLSTLELGDAGSIEKLGKSGSRQTQTLGFSLSHFECSPSSSMEITGETSRWSELGPSLLILTY